MLTIIFPFIFLFPASYILTKNSDFCYNKAMSESQKISENDNMGREKFWEDLGRPENDGLALKMFQEECCGQCSCKSK